MQHSCRRALSVTHCCPIYEPQSQATAMSLRCPKDTTVAPVLVVDAIRMDCRWVVPSGYTAKVIRQSLHSFGHRGLQRCWLNLSFWPKVLKCPKVERSAGQTPPALQSEGKQLTKNNVHGNYTPADVIQFPQSAPWQICLNAMWVRLPSQKKEDISKGEGLWASQPQMLGSHQGQKWLKLNMFCKKKKSE